MTQAPYVLLIKSNRLFLLGFGIFTLILIGISCATKHSAMFEVESGIDFRKYSTINIARKPLDSADPQVLTLEHVIDDALSNELEEMGYIIRDDSELLILWSLEVQTQLQPGLYNPYNTRWSRQQGVDVYVYHQSEFCIHFIDQAIDRVVWSAQISNIQTGTHDQLSQRLKEVVKSIINSYKKDVGIHKIKNYVSK